MGESRKQIATIWSLKLKKEVRTKCKEQRGKQTKNSEIELQKLNQSRSEIHILLLEKLRML